jgi:hypothetical protein
MPNEKSGRKKMKRRLILTASLILIVGALVGYVIWLFSSHVYDPAEASTPPDVTHYTSVPPPSEARDIRVAAFSYQQAGFTFVRFTAPVDVCMKYAAAIMPNNALKPLTPDQGLQDLGTIHGASFRFHDLRWFDLPYDVGYWSTQAGQLVFRYPPTQEILKTSFIVGADADTSQNGYLDSSVRVDLSRGVFYFFQKN